MSSKQIQQSQAARKKTLVKKTPSQIPMPQSNDSSKTASDSSQDTSTFTTSQHTTHSSLTNTFVDTQAVGAIQSPAKSQDATLDVAATHAPLDFVTTQVVAPPQVDTQQTTLDTQQTTIDTTTVAQSVATTPADAQQ